MLCSITVVTAVKKFWISKTTFNTLVTISEATLCPYSIPFTNLFSWTQLLNFNLVHRINYQTVIKKRIIFQKIMIYLPLISHVFVITAVVISIFCALPCTGSSLTPEEWQSGSSSKCSPCSCSLTRKTSLGGSLVKYVNCSNLFVDLIPSDLPDDTEFLDLSRTPVVSGSSLMYPDLPTGLVNATNGLHKLKYLDLTGNSFNTFNSSSFSHLEFLSGIFGLEITGLTSGSLSGLHNLAILELRTAKENIPDDLFLPLKLSVLKLHLENAPSLASSLFNPLATSLKTLTIVGNKMTELPESLLDNLLLLQKLTLIVNDMDSIPEHLLHGSSLFRSLNLKQGKFSFHTRLSRLVIFSPTQLVITGPQNCCALITDNDCDARHLSK